MLYVMLTQRSPYDLMTATDAPESFRVLTLSQLGSTAVPSKLDATALKAIHCNPEDRYQSASDFANDLATFRPELEKSAM